MKWLIAASVGAMAACGGAARPVQAPVAPVVLATPAQCDVAIGQMYDRILGDAHRTAAHSAGEITPNETHALGVLTDALVPQLEAAMAQSCTADHWSQTMLACLGWDDMDYDACAKEQLSADQRAKADAAMGSAIAAVQRASD